jgi:hypothetical protein
MSLAKDQPAIYQGDSRSHAWTGKEKIEYSYKPVDELLKFEAEANERLDEAVLSKLKLKFNAVSET